MGSEEESGKDWSELEEEAARGKFEIFCNWSMMDTYINAKFAVRKETLSRQNNLSVLN